MPEGFDPAPTPTGADWGAFESAQPGPIPNVSGYVAQLNGSTGTMFITAGDNITINEAGSRITIVGASGAAGVSVNGSTGHISIVAGGEIGLTNNASTISISAPTGNIFSFNGSTGSVSLIAGANISLSSNASSITISGVSAAGAFTQLTDVPNSYVGQAGSLVAVNSAESGLIFTPPPPPSSDTRLLSGGVVVYTGTGFDFIVTRAVYLINGIQYDTLTDTPVTLASPDPTFDRIDVFAVDDTGSAIVIQGTPGGPPVEPQVDPATQLKLTEVLVEAGSSGPTITDENIYLENTEWTTSVNSGNINPNSTNNPRTGTKCIEATTAGSGNYVQMVKPASGTINLNNFSVLQLYIRSKAAWASNRGLSIFWMNGASNVGVPVVLKNGTFGFDSTNTTSYQLIAIPITAFSPPSPGTVTTLKITVAGSGGTIGWYLDDILAQAGVNNGGGVTRFTQLADVPGSYVGQANKVVVVGTAETGLSFASSTNFSLNGSSSSVSLVAGANITLNTGVRSITIVGAAGTAANFSLNGSSSSVSLVAGANITLSSSNSTITIKGIGATDVQAFTLNGTTDSVSLVAGAGIGFSTSNSTITISNTRQFSTVSLSASGNTTGATSSGTWNNVLAVSGMGIVSVGAGNGTISISATTPSVTNFSTISASASGNTTGGSSSGTFNNAIVFSGAGVASVGVGNGSVTISVPAGGANYSTISMSAAGNSTVSSTGTINNIVSISGAGIVSVGVGAGSITISASTPTVTNFSTISLSASGNTTGATSSGTFNNILAFSGMGIASVGAGNGTVSISVPTVTNFSTISVSASGNTTGATSSGTYNNALVVSGAGIASIGAGNGSITVSVTTPSVTNYSTISGNIAGNTAGSSTFTIGNTLQISLTGGLSGTASGSSITLSAGAAGAALTQSLSASGNTTGATSSGTYGSVLAASGMGGVSVGAGNGTISISGPSQTTLVAGSGINLASGGSSITINALGPAVSYTQNQNLAEVAGTVVSKTGTVTGTAGIGSSLFLHRLPVMGVMSLTEVDVAMSIAFPATSQGAGTISRSFVIYSFGNSTSLATVMSVSGTSAWGTGTATAGASSSLTQFQGGWSTPLIQPMTFASTSLAPGDYVVGQLFNFAQGSSTWTINLYGAQGASSVGALSSGGLVAASGITGSSRLASDWWPMMLSASFTGSNSMSAITLTAGSSASTSNTKALNISIFAAASSAQFVALAAISNSVSLPITSVGSTAGSILSASTSMTAGSPAFPNFGYIGTGSTTSGLPTAFFAGIMSTGAIPTAITVTSTAVTYSGSVAFQQPWFALIGQ